MGGQADGHGGWASMEKKSHGDGDGGVCQNR